MKTILIAGIAFSGYAQAYSYSYTGERNLNNALREIQRRQECNLKNQEKHQKYIKCVASCQRKKKIFGADAFCFTCSTPSFSSCL